MTHYTRGGILVDLTVDPAFRSMGPALKLIRGVMEQETLGSDILYGFPNKKSYLIYKRVGFSNLGFLVRYAKVTNYSKQIAKYSKLASVVFGPLIDRMSLLYGALVSRWLNRKYECASQEATPEGIDCLLNEDGPIKKHMLVRDHAFLQWRFEQNYKHKYKFFTIRHLQDKSLAGYICYRTTPSEDVIVEDFLALDDDVSLKALFRLFCQQMRKLGQRSVSLEFFGNGDVVGVLRSLGFMRRDEAPIIFWGKSNDAMLKHAESWYITTADRD